MFRHCCKFQFCVKFFSFLFGQIFLGLISPTGNCFYANTLGLGQHHQKIKWPTKVLKQQLVKCDHFSSAGRSEHVLLDSFHLHDSKCLLEEDWLRCSSSRCRQNSGSFGATISQILPVGLLLPFLPGIAYSNNVFKAIYCTSQESTERSRIY